MVSAKYIVSLEFPQLTQEKNECMSCLWFGREGCLLYSHELSEDNSKMKMKKT